MSALTYWYETYYEVWKGGQYFKEVAKMHKSYGTSQKYLSNTPEVESLINPKRPYGTC